MDVVFEAPQNAFRQFTDIGGGRHAERVEAYPPSKLMTDEDGEYARVRVDVGQTGFFAGREFRSFIELDIPTGQTQVVRIASPIDFILYSFEIELTLASLRATLKKGGTAGGTFGVTLPSLSTNEMSSASGYVGQIVVTSGGTHSGGTTYDIADVVSGSNINKAIVQTATEDKPLGFPAGDYYMILTNTDGANAKGVLKLRYEERP